MSATNSIPLARRILVRGVNWLGDAVMTTPALQRLREKFPNATISLLTPEKLAELWRGQRCVDEILTFAAGESPLRIGRRLRGGAYDIALVLPNSPRSALEVWAAGIPRRVGYGARWRSWFLTQTITPRPGAVAMRKRSPREVKRLVKTETPGCGQQLPPASLFAHQLHHYLHLAAAIGAAAQPIAPALEVSRAELDSALVKWLGREASSISSDRPLALGVSPSAAYGEAKRWPIENFATVLKRVSEQCGTVQWVVFGAREDEPLCQELAMIAGVPVVNLAGKTSLRELMALLRACRVLLTNDSGPMHVAAALGTPVVVPFGSTSPELTGPGLPGDPRHRLLRSNAVCSPCFRRTCPIDFRCMKGISAEQVSREMIAAMQRNPAA